MAEKLALTRKYYVPARANGWAVTVAYLVISTTREAARQKLQAHFDSTQQQFTALKHRIRVATEAGIELFKKYRKSVIK